MSQDDHRPQMRLLPDIEVGWVGEKFAARLEHQRPGLAALSRTDLLAERQFAREELERARHQLRGVVGSNPQLLAKSRELVEYRKARLELVEDVIRKRRLLAGTGGQQAGPRVATKTILYAHLATGLLDQYDSVNAICQAAAEEIEEKEGTAFKWLCDRNPYYEAGGSDMNERYDRLRTAVEAVLHHAALREVREAKDDP